MSVCCASGSFNINNFSSRIKDKIVHTVETSKRELEERIPCIFSLN